jgi:hypothetical protein
MEDRRTSNGIASAPVCLNVLAVAFLLRIALLTGKLPLIEIVKMRKRAFALSEDIGSILAPRREWDIVQLRRRDRNRNSGQLYVVRNAIAARTARWMIDGFDATLSRHLRGFEGRLSTGDIWKMTRNFSETLPKIMRTRTALLNYAGSRCQAAARDVGLIGMLRDRTVGQIASEIIGSQVGDPCGAQVICYREGDYQGPHNDYQPEERHLRRGYVDFHISLPSRGVAEQYLIYERRGHLNAVIDLGREPLLLVYVLPFWHQVTPLVAAKGMSQEASRWLMLNAFEINE